MVSLGTHRKRVKRSLMEKDMLYYSLYILFITEPPELVPINFGKEIFDEGTSAQILCSVSAGDEPLTITWSFHGNDISSDSSGIVTSNFGSTTSFLMIKSVNQGHRGLYTCLAKNKAGSATSTAELRVNG